MSRRPLLAGNWKLHHGPAAAAALARELEAQLGTVDDVDLVVFPSALSVPAVCEVLHDSRIAVGVQSASPHPSGAYTGTNSAEMARELGCGWVLAGHSEVRRDLGETDARVAASAAAGLAAGLIPMICIGESLQERESDRVEEVLGRQLAQGLAGLTDDQVATCVLAYEPIWAIGTGETATPEIAQATHGFIREWLARTYPSFVAEQMRVLYGGSVKPGNAGELMTQPDIDGALVGGASLQAASFAGIVAAAR